MQASLEQQLNSIDRQEREEAFKRLTALFASGAIVLPDSGHAFNLHCHSFFSFNGYGYSPTGLAWCGRKLGLRAMALVDFDVLDGVDEFLETAASMGLRSGAGMETRVFVPEFAEDEINSPGEPGVAYHVGIGFVSSTVKDPVLLHYLKALAQNRTQTIIERVNTLLHEIRLDYQRDVLSLTPNGNPTERHVCAAYDNKARALFPDQAALANYWSSKLGVPADVLEKPIDSPPVLQGMIRAKTMKSGGVGYIPARGEDFPRLADVNRFILENGAIPTFAFLDGTSSGEQRMEELLDVMVASGVAAVNIIPDRNWNIANPEIRALKVRKLGEFIQQARDRDLPILVGTEMNAHGQRLVDDFDAQELKPFAAVFEEGMYILNGHTVLERAGGRGYMSAWAKDTFNTVRDKNAFYREAGKRAVPGVKLQLGDGDTPEALLGRLTGG
ncbi:MAG: hypothetical protein BWX80_01872 [Candidatus Hydrogenedentes bacterium ADurb.Bin101]|nr:MAG: hypothetical protein BWX80_01872 [Candidatus Hydrogenedentes bacterium ADurb.Bin101]